VITDELVVLPRAPSPSFLEWYGSDTLPGVQAKGSGEAPMHERIDIVVDGSGDGHSVALFPGEEVFFSYERGASNNEAEFNAVILALEHLPEHAHARIRTDSQVVVWHLSAAEQSQRTTFLKKKVAIKDLIVAKNIRVDIQWIPRKQNDADRFLKHYIASLCGANGCEPLYRRVRRLESENTQLRARLKRAMKLLERRSAFPPDAALSLEMLQ
jgi:ribonuclease HI